MWFEGGTGKSCLTSLNVFVLHLGDITVNKRVTCDSDLWSIRRLGRVSYHHCVTYTLSTGQAQTCNVTEQKQNHL